ncbi:hypothetical protein J7K74_00700 [Candidatus Woesearchaeota archaeon]|nr:hypothetical protein [Candidatus Woesearchaeota archaeon]
MSRLRGMIYTIDMALSLTLFMAALIIALLFLYRHGISHDYTSTDADLLIETLLSQGIPENWSSTTIISPGLLSSNGALSIEKFREIQNISYEDLKLLIGVRSEFFFYIHNSTSGIMINNTCGYGYTDIMPYNCSPIDAIISLNPSRIARRDAIIAIPPNMAYLTIYTWKK